MQALAVLFAALLAFGVSEATTGAHNPCPLLEARRVRAGQALTARRQACHDQGRRPDPADPEAVGGSSLRCS